MPKNQHRLTPELILQLCTRIRGGAFEHVACESLGVPYEEYQKWLELARRKRSRKIYRDLAAAVHQARAEARLKPEMEMRDKNPRLWLLQGPGKETNTRRGWSSSPQALKDEQSSGSFLTLELLKLIGALVKIVRPYPEIREAIIADLNQRLPHVEF